MVDRRITCLMGRERRMGRVRDGVSELAGRVAELINVSADDGEPRSINRGDSAVQHSSYDVSLPDRRQSEEYELLYRSNPHVEMSINQFAEEVWEAGWYVVADDPQTRELLTEWLTQATFDSGEVNEDLSQFGIALVIEHEVSGTVLVEIVRDENGLPVGFKLMDESEVKIYTLPDQNVLVPPDADVDYGPGHTTPSGKTPAYVQYDQGLGFTDKEEQSFTRDDVIKFARKPGIGDVRGHSRLRTVQRRVEGYIQKLQDNDDAIASKAYPMVHFQLGTEDDPYTPEEKERFIQEYSDENYEPGKMLAVGGDVDIDTFSGETADIRDSLDHDIDHIMTAMPTPKFAIGSHTSGVTGSVATVQERQYKKRVRRMRNKIAEKFTPVLQELAEEHQALDGSGVRLELGRPNGEVAPEDVQGNIIQYQTTADQDNQGSGAGASSSGPTQQAAPVQTAPVTGANDQRQQQRHDMAADGPTERSETRLSDTYVDTVEADTNYFDVDLEATHVGHDPASEELADPRRVDTRDAQQAIRTDVTELLVEARDDAIESLASTYGGSTAAASGSFAGVASSAMQDTIQQSDLQSEVQATTRDVIERTLATFGQPNHPPELDVSFKQRHRSLARTQAATIERDVESVVTELFERMHERLRQGAVDDESLSTVLDRIEADLDRNELQARAGLVARMRLQELVNRTKLQEYEIADDIVGVRWDARCDTDTTRVCRDLGGCRTGDAAVAYFDDGSIGQQFREQTDLDIHADFQPFDGAPPIHYGCRSELLPVLERN